MTTQYLEDPSDWVKRFSALIPPHSRVLDLACGHGRHARMLASQGHQVEAVDKDVHALATLAGIEGITVRQADLEGGPWPYHTEAFDAVVVSRYLYRPMLPSILKVVASQGVLIYETFMVGNEEYGKPTNPAFLLRAGELLELVRGRMAVVAFEQGAVTLPRPAMMQRLCAVRANGYRLVLPESSVA